MATLRDLKQRITGVKNTQKITKAMKMVAAARLRRAQENTMSARPYTEKLTGLLSNLLNLEKEFSNPLLEKREINKVAFIVITSDRGLCGAFNMNVLKRVEGLIKEEYKEYFEDGNLELHTIGKKATDYLKINFELASTNDNVFSDLKYEFASSMVGNLVKRYLDGDLDKVVIISNEFVTVATQKVEIKQLVPIVPEKNDESDSSFGEFLFEPNKKEIIDNLLPKYLNAKLWTTLLSSYAAELAARMTAMDMATENANELIRSLNIKYNKERQASITTEILEIVSGANALKEA